MTKSRQQTARKPATKFAHLQKKMQKQEVQAKKASSKKKRKMCNGQIKVISKYVLAIFMVGAGTMHFVNPEFYLKIMPLYLPFHEELEMVSGVCVSFQEHRPPSAIFWG